MFPLFADVLEWRAVVLAYDTLYAQKRYYMWLYKHRWRQQKMGFFWRKSPTFKHFDALWTSSTVDIHERLIPLNLREGTGSPSTILCSWFVRGFMGGANPMGIRTVVELNKTNPFVLLKEWRCVREGNLYITAHPQENLMRVTMLLLSKC